MAAFRYLISGYVQGVGYRYFALRRASSLGLAGYVRNLPDGSVEVVAEGSDEALEVLESALQEGPLSARVEGVARSLAASPGRSDFTIR